MPSPRGFTLLELLLSMALVAILFAVAMPIYFAYLAKNALVTAAQTTAFSLRRAQTLSRGMERDSAWGVAVSEGVITVFKGESFAARDSDFDEIFTYPSSLTASGMTEVVFAKFSGLPESTGTFTFTSRASDVRNVTVNAQGMVEY